MKKTVARLLMGFVIMTFAFGLFTGCQIGTTARPDRNSTVSGSRDDSDYVEGKELMCLIDTKEEAEAIARQYGIQLVEFSYGVATFHTDENPNDVIAMGLKLGYPELSLNRVMHTY